MIESIQIKNFRGIQQGQIEQFKKFNLLVGPNNSGKTAVLEALYLASTVEPESLLDAGHKKFRVRIPGYDLMGENPMLRVLARHGYHAETPSNGGSDRILNVNLSQRNAPLRSFTLRGSAGSESSWPPLLFVLDPPSEATDEQMKNSTWILLGRLWGEQLRDFSNERLVYCWKTELTHYRCGSATWRVRGEFPSPALTLFYDVANTLSHIPANFYNQMLTTVPGWMHKIAESLVRVLGLKPNFNVAFLPPDAALDEAERTWMQGYLAPAEKIALTIDSYGDGARSAFKVLTPLTALATIAGEDTPGLFLWEEPELFQNPQTLSRLLAEVADLLRNRPIQVFIATHSLEVAAILVQLVQDGLIAEDELTAIRLNLYEGQLASSSFNHREIQTWTEMDLDLRVPSGKVDSPLKYQFRETANAAEHTDDD